MCSDGGAAGPGDPWSGGGGGGPGGGSSYPGGYPASSQAGQGSYATNNMHLSHDNMVSCHRYLYLVYTIFHIALLSSLCYDFFDTQNFTHV